MADNTQVWVSKEVRDMLRTIKRANRWDTYDTTLRNLLQEEYTQAVEKITPKLRRPG